MGKLINLLIYVAGIAIIAFIGVPNLQICIGYLNDKPEVIGTPPQLEKEELSEDFYGYRITYNLNGGTATGNPEYYTLFTDTFTLNAPVKENYEFIGWTGSNGDMPQFTVSICTGSCGDVEFTANYIIKIDDISLELTKEKLSWNFDNRVAVYRLYVNDELKQTITTDCDVEIDVINSYCNNGKNTIKVAAIVDGIEARTSEIDYTYYDVSELENLSLNINFSRLSDRKSIGVTSRISSSYSYTGEYIGGVYHDEKLLPYDPETALLIALNSEFEYSNLYCDLTIFELMQLIESAYQNENRLLLNVSGKFSFILNDSFKTIYTPYVIYLNINYDTMFNETPFYEGCVVKMNDFSTINNAEIYTSESVNERAITSAIWLDTEPKSRRLDYSINLSDNKEFFGILSVSDSASISEDEFNNYMSDCKIYLNCDYYLAIKDNFSDFYKYLHTYVVEERNKVETTQNLWSSNKITYTVDITQFFYVFTAVNNIEINYNYTIMFDVTTYGI